MPRNRLRVCTAMTARPLLPAKTDTRIPRVVLIYLQTHERRHMRYPLLAPNSIGFLPGTYLTNVCDMGTVECIVSKKIGGQTNKLESPLVKGIVARV